MLVWGQWLDLMILEVFPNLSDSVILSLVYTSVPRPAQFHILHAPPQMTETKAVNSSGRMFKILQCPYSQLFQWVLSKWEYRVKSPRM